MGKKYKTYSRSVFSHKRASWRGMDQGKGALYRGDSVEMTLNVLMDDNVFKNRVGQEIKDTSAYGIISGKKTLSGVTVASGTNIFFDEDFPALDL